MYFTGRFGGVHAFGYNSLKMNQFGWSWNTLST